MATGYRVGHGKVISRGYDRTDVKYEFEPDPHYPKIYPSVREAKIAMWSEMEPDCDSPDLLVMKFDAYARNVGGIKILRVKI